MNWATIWRLLRKDLKLGPRSPIVLYAFILPLVLTILIQGVFGSLFEGSPRLAIVDHGDSEITREALALDGIRVTVLESEEELLAQVESHDFDAGLILPADFDEQVQAGAAPPLEFYVSGESLASDRIVVAVTAIDLVRGAAGEPAPVEVVVETIGDESIELSKRLLPLIMIYAVAIAGAMVPAMSLVEEKAKGTIDAVLVTPVTVHEVMAEKALLGAFLATLTGVMTLAINNAFGSQPAAIILAIVLGAIMMAELGVILGAWAPDTNTLFTAVKAGGILMFYPVVFYIWPGLPQWVARLSPTYYILQPIFELSLGTSGLTDVWGDLAIAALICIALIPLVHRSGVRMERRLGTGGKVSAAEPDPEPAGM